MAVLFLAPGDDSELAERRVEEEGKGEDAWQPGPRDRRVTAALQAYAAMATSADKGGVRDVTQLHRWGEPEP